MFLLVPDETPEYRARFDAKWVETPEGCHRWTGFFRSKEYGGFQIGSTTFRAHRVAYVWANGEGLPTDLHHTCGNTWCVNPEHLLPVTIAEPQEHHRGEYEDLSAHGNDLDYIDPRGWRGSREDRNEAMRRYREANRDAINAKRRANRQHVTHEPRECALPGCGEWFVPIRSTKKYHSEECQAQANNRKQYLKRSARK